MDVIRLMNKHRPIFLNAVSLIASKCHHDFHFDLFWMILKLRIKSISSVQRGRRTLVQDGRNREISLRVAKYENVFSTTSMQVGQQ